MFARKKLDAIKDESGKYIRGETDNIDALRRAWAPVFEKPASDVVARSFILKEKRSS